MDKNTGGPAFPVGTDKLPNDTGGVSYIFQEGMTLRDWYAGQALTGLLANGELEKTRKEFECGADQECRVMANMCYDYANAMIKERDNA